MNKRVLVLVCCAVLAGLSQSVQAAPLNLNLSYYPDIVTGFIEVTYTAADNHLLIDGFAMHIWDGVSAEPSMKPGLSSLKSDLIGSILYSGFPCQQFVRLTHGPIKLCDDAYSDGRALNGPGSTSGYRAMPTKFKFQIQQIFKLQRPLNQSVNKQHYFS